jgi:hypothetical protein
LFFLRREWHLKHRVCQIYLRPLDQQNQACRFFSNGLRHQTQVSLHIMIHLNGPLSPYLIDQYRKFQNNNIILAALITWIASATYFDKAKLD